MDTETGDTSERGLRGNTQVKGRMTSFPDIDHLRELLDTYELLQ